MRGLEERRLYEFRQMYKIYPQLGSQVLPFALQISQSGILRLATAISDQALDDTILRSATAKLENNTLETWQTPIDKYNMLQKDYRIISLLVSIVCNYHHRMRYENIWKRMYK